MVQAPAHRGCVLLVEDEAVIAVALQDDLEEVGYKVAGPFTVCADALAWLESHQPTFAVLDTVLKDGPCKDVALKLNSLGVPFLVYSGMPENMNALPELARAPWIEKPATAQAVLHALAGLGSKAIPIV
jgi:DNA-binding response OmpR family regulator